MKKMVIILILLLSVSFVSYALEDAEVLYWEVRDRVSERARENAWIIEPDEGWNFTEREEYIYQMGILEGYDWGWENGYELGYESAREEFDSEY